MARWVLFALAVVLLSGCWLTSSHRRTDRPFFSRGPSQKEIASRENKASVMARSERWEEARDVWSELIELDPENAGYLLSRAEAEANSGNFSAAEDTLALIDALGKSEPKKLLLEARLAEQQGQWRAALDAWLRIGERDPENIRAELKVAEMHVRTGHPERATPIYRSVLADDDLPAFARADAAVALAQAYCRLRRWPAAVDAVSTGLALRKSPSAAERYLLAQALRQAGNVPQSSAIMQTVTEEYPNYEPPRGLQALFEVPAAWHSGDQR